MPSRRVQQYQAGGPLVGLTARTLSVPAPFHESKGKFPQERNHTRVLDAAMGTLAEGAVVREQLNRMPSGGHQTLLEEGTESSNRHLMRHRSRSSMSAATPPRSREAENPWQRSSSPEHLRQHSRHSSPSEVGDSGVSSEHDTPPPISKNAVRCQPLRHRNSSDSDSESNLSNDSLPDAFHPKKPSNHLLSRSALRSSSSRPSSGGKGNLPEALLSEIREKWTELQQRRAQQGRPGDAVLGRAGSQAQWSSSRHPHRRSCPASPTLSRSSSTNFPSSLSLFEEEVDSAARSSPVSFESWRQQQPPPPQMAPVRMDDARSLFECRDDEAGHGFAGLRDIFSPQQESTIKSYKGTVRGVKNRVRAGIATFTSDQRILKHFMERERGKVVVYVTTLGIIRDTYERCLRIRKILWTLLVRFEERDVFMARDTQIQLLDRLHARGITVPHVFLEGQYLGDAEVIERLNECGELRRLLQPYRKASSNSFCNSCGGFRLLPCSACNGSKKSVHRNDFTLEFVALKCSSCDESGLVKCLECAEYKEEHDDHAPL
ncbi:uncharacterized protein LOC135213652 [Macrobrachium nipponense]|uniref:uncharacterized protein LOC135213652 n=1 Tax=Macrobrachium nipponense TaxID=159736 RepID=UPI0030C7DB1D